MIFLRAFTFRSFSESRFIWLYFDCIDRSPFELISMFFVSEFSLWREG